MDDYTYATKIKQILKECIQGLSLIRNQFLYNPLTDFTRNRKINFESFINLCLKMNGGTLQKELLEYFDYDYDTPTKSSFCQQRAKVSPEAMKFLYELFTELIRDADVPITWNGYLLIACDGSDINIPYNPNDKETFHQPKEKKGYNQLHLNAFYDCLNGIYLDCILEPSSKSHERAAFNTMVDRYSLETPCIIFADRGYESYNLLAHIIKSGQKFVVRLKDAQSNGILSSKDFTYDENGQFDEQITRILTWKQSNEIKQNRDVYTYVPRKNFDFYTGTPDNAFYTMSLRIVCLEVESGIFEYLVTNLDKEEYSISVLKDLYHYRWGEETSFRDLKYTIDLLSFHSKKRETVEQEIWAKLVVYNFCESIVRHLSNNLRKETEKTRKYDYMVNFATAVCICKKFLKTDDDTFDPCKLMRKYLTPIRPGRKFHRKIKPKSSRTFFYRAA